MTFWNPKPGDTPLSNLRYLAGLSSSWGQSELEKCTALAALLRQKLKLKNEPSAYDLANPLQGILEERARRARHDALGELHTSRDPKGYVPPSSDIAAAGELIWISDNDHLRELCSIRGMGYDAWVNSVKNAPSKRKRQIRAGLWRNKNDRRVRDEEEELMASFVDAITDHLGDPAVIQRLTATLVTDNTAEGTATSSDAHESPQSAEPDADSIAPHTSEAASTDETPVGATTSKQTPLSELREYFHRILDALQPESKPVTRYFDALNQRAPWLHRVFGAIGLAFIITMLLAFLIPPLVRYITPRPASEPLRSIFVVMESTPLFATRTAAILALVLALLLSGRRGLVVVGRVGAFLLLVTPMALFIAVKADYDAQTSSFDNLENSDLPYWEKVAGESFSEPVECRGVADDPDPDLTGRTSLRECRAVDGALRFGVREELLTGRLFYPRRQDIADPTPILLGDFYAETRFRPVDSSPSACSLAIQRVSDHRAMHLHLDARPHDRYPGFGAELMTYDNTFKKTVTATSGTLPYVERPAFWEDEYSTDGNWVTLGIARRDDVYHLYVNERHVAEYHEEDKAYENYNTTSIHLSVLAGTELAGGNATCDFDYLKVHAKP